MTKIALLTMLTTPPQQITSSPALITNAQALDLRDSSHHHKHFSTCRQKLPSQWHMVKNTFSVPPAVGFQSTISSTPLLGTADFGEAAGAFTRTFVLVPCPRTTFLTTKCPWPSQASTLDCSLHQTNPVSLLKAEGPGKRNQAKTQKRRLIPSVGGSQKCHNRTSPQGTLSQTAQETTR